MTQSNETKRYNDEGKLCFHQLRREDGTLISNRHIGFDEDGHIESQLVDEFDINGNFFCEKKYDERGNLVREKREGNRRSITYEYEYDSRNNLIFKDSDSRGGWEIYEYDSKNRLVYWQDQWGSKMELNPIQQVRRCFRNLFKWHHPILDKYKTDEISYDSMLNFIILLLMTSSVLVILVLILSIFK